LIATGEGSASDWIGYRLCVSVDEAKSWIAFRNLSGTHDVGARPLDVLRHYWKELDENYASDLGRLELAEQFLADWAAKGKLRIYACEGLADDQHKEALRLFPLQLPTAFLERATLTYEENFGYTLSVLEEVAYYNLAVDYADLVREFWGDTEVNCPKPVEATERHSIEAQQLSRPFSRRGRPPRYRWSMFAAEMVRRSLAGPIPNQAALEQHMAQWCLDDWGSEPAASVIREWVQPTFKMIRRSPAEGRPANDADNSSRDFSASPK
jgi:hypothetical protein